MRNFFLCAIVLIALLSAPLVASDGVRLDRGGEKWAEKTLKKMSLEQKVGQMFVVWARIEFMNINSPQYLQLRDTMRKYHVGGFGVTVPVDGSVLLKNQPYEAAALTNQLQHDSELPLIIAADFERGLAMRLNGVTGFPHAMAFGAAGKKDFAFQFGKITAEEARAIGVHWNWYPSADVNSNPKNPIINTRSFGEDPKTVADMVSAYIAGARGAGMLTTLKHFPGHGDTDADTHLSLARVNGDLQRLNSLELPPFKAGIDAGVDSVMVAHVTVPALEPDPNRPATVSYNITTKLLKEQMGFKGLVVTDALDMGALTKAFASADRAHASGRAAVEAVKAGNDVMLIPSDLDGAYNGIVNAVRSGEIPEARINEAVLKILKMKASVGLHKNRFVDLNKLQTVISAPENIATAQNIADSAVTLVRNNQQVIPLKRTGTPTAGPAYTPMQLGNHVLTVVFTDDLRGEGGRMFQRQLRLRVPDARFMYVDENVAAGLAPNVLSFAQQAEKVVVLVDVVPTAGRAVAGDESGSAGLAPNSQALLASLIEKFGDKTAVVAMGNPYIASSIPNVQTYLCTFSNTAVADTSAVKALFGEIGIQGHMPVTIPGIADRGFGISLPASSQPAVQAQK